MLCNFIGLSDLFDRRQAANESPRDNTTVWMGLFEIAVELIANKNTKSLMFSNVLIEQINWMHATMIALNRFYV